MAALEAGSLVRVGIASAIPRAAATEVLVAGSRVAAAEAIGSRAVIGAESSAGVNGARSAIGRTATAGESAAMSPRVILTEAQATAITGRRGLSGLFDELSKLPTRPTIDEFGRVMMQGRPILQTARDGSLRLWSSGELVGQIRGQRVFALDSTGAALTEIGAMETSSLPLAGAVPIEISRIRPGWYRVMIGDQTVIPPTELALLAMVAQEELNRIEQSGGQLPTTLPDLLQGAEAGIEDGKYVRALLYAERAVRMYPSNQEARSMLNRVRRIRSILK